MSPSSRRAWIEILGYSSVTPRLLVALLAEGVDRNFVVLLHLKSLSVALLAEGVDRNSNRPVFSSNFASVALLAEGVDRNSTVVY